MTSILLPDPAGRAILTFGYAPPRATYDPEKLARITRGRSERLARMPLDALVLYDVQDEGSRTDEERPFPYLPTIDPLQYSREHLTAEAIAALPRVIYRAVPRHSREEMERFLSSLDPEREATVLVGSPSRDADQRTTLGEAYELYERLDSQPDEGSRDGQGLTPGAEAARRRQRTVPLLGGVTIPERHAQKLDEDQRLRRKMDHGCSFFVSQCVYDAEAARNLLSDYHYAMQDAGEAPARIILTLSPCGSPQTLRFMKWLGIRFPRWLENDLDRSGDILERSMDACRRIAGELTEFCAERSIPFGFNVESVSIRKTEIDAAEELVGQIDALLAGSGLR
ncbi:MAG: methylenetetrahydrofolate reductase [Spirochaetota bacterium]